MTFSKIGSKPHSGGNTVFVFLRFFSFLPSAVGFLRPAAGGRKIPSSEIKSRFQNRADHAKTQWSIGKMKILY